MLMAGVAYFILTRILIADHGRESTLAVAVGNDIKGKVSVLIYLVAILVSFSQPCACVLLHVVVAIVPPRDFRVSCPA